MVLNPLGGDYLEIKPPAGWLGYLNQYRAAAALPPLTEEPAWSRGNNLHARYSVKNDILDHSEDRRNEWYTPEGAEAAQYSNLMASADFSASDNYAIDAWMQAPFHALGILDPKLQRVGYGSYREPDGGLQMTAGLDIIRGLSDATAQSVQYPILWPEDGTTTPLSQHWGEYPDPLSSCPGYRAPSGLPVILQLGPGNITPEVSASSFSQGETVLESCVFTEATYTNTDPGSQSMGRSILDGRDAVVLIPRQPLFPGKVYTVSITANGQTYTWSFRVSKTASAPLADSFIP